MLQPPVMAFSCRDLVNDFEGLNNERFVNFVVNKLWFKIWSVSARFYPVEFMVSQCIAGGKASMTILDAM